jgi:hypothetical protein
MASFSKQYIKNSNLDFKWDFDLEEIFNSLEKGYYYPALCEGFGFTAVGKDNDGNEMVFIRDFDNEDGGEWIQYEELFNKG